MEGDSEVMGPICDSLQLCINSSFKKNFGHTMWHTAF